MNNVDDDEKFNRKWWLNPMDSKQLSDGDRRNAKLINLWIVIAALLYAGVVKIVKLFEGGVDEWPIWFWLFMFSPIVATIFLIHALYRFCRDTKDELLKRVTYESLSIGFAVAFFIHICSFVAKVVVGPFELHGILTFWGLVLGYFIGFVLLCRKNCYV